MSTEDDNVAKLILAQDYALRAKFNYTNEQGDTHDVRLEVHEADYDYVSGNTDEGDYKRYRIDRINGKVAIR